jgi:hypothetical protein
VPWVRVIVLLALGSWFAWAQSTPGGVSARVNGFIEHVRGDVEQATADPQLRQAADALDAAFARDGHYPSAEQMRDDPAFAVGVGVNVTICGPRDVVLGGLTGNGNVTRLLLDGKVHGDISGAVACPLDPDHPAPWK